jgi:ketosteroid isomerase-like protein
VSKVPTQIPSQRVLQASLSGDVSIVMSLFSDDAVVMPPNDSALFGKEEIRSWWEEYFQSFRVTSSVETERDLTVAGNQAFERSSFSVTINPKEPGDSIHDDIRALTVWIYDADGGWKISHQIWNSTKPVGSGTNRYMTKIMQKNSDRPPG